MSNTPVDIATLDLSPYQSCPLLPTEGTLALARDLLDARPEPAPAHVETIAAKLAELVQATAAAMVERIDAIEGADLPTEMAFDAACDRFWSATRSKLEERQLYTHPGLDLLDDKQREAIDLDERREQAALATELNRRLFGRDSVGMLNRPYPQQAELTGSRLGFINTSDRRDEYIEVIGEARFTTLMTLQARYEAMVRARSKRDVQTLANLHDLRTRLQRMIIRYSSAVLSLLDEDEPSSGDTVVKALQPILNARQRRERNTVLGDQDESPDDLEFANTEPGEESAAE